MISYASLIFERNSHCPDRVAVVDRNGQRTTSWKELYDKSRRVAAYAVKQKLSGVVPVGMERSVEGVATLLGLNLAGVGVAPISDSAPRERVLLIEKETEHTTWGIADYAAAMETDPLEDCSGITPTDPTMVIFTSGSTGVPKGVMLSNEAVARANLRASERLFLYTAEDVALQNASFSFVAILLDLMAPLYAGAVVHLLPEAARKDADLMTDYINSHGITTAFTSPKVLRLLGKMPTVRTIIVGGERLSDFSADGYRLINIYGMSEMVSEAFCYHVTTPEKNTPIGKPDPDFECYLVDESGNLAEEGEVCVSGAIAMGYYRHPELSEGVFTKNPFSDKPGHEVLLHSGDLARRLPDGNLLFLNRLDFMIKINGQRVEPGETEAAVKEVCNVRDACVVGYTEEDGRTYLAAYCESDTELDVASFREKLSAKLPSYMIPSYWVRLDRFPLNANGKIDRKALPRPFEKTCLADYVAPVGETESAICRAFEQVLGIPKAGSTDDFFCLGGDSIKAMEAAKFVSSPLLGANDILRWKTPAEIARRIDGKEPASASAVPTAPNFAPLTDSQMGIYLQCMTRPESVMYNLPMRLAFARGDNDENQVKEAIDSVLRLHPALYAFLKPEGESILICRNLFPSAGICTVTLADTDEEDAAFVRPFSLFSGPLCRAKAVLTPSEIILYFDCHHIVCDGTSMSRLIREFSLALQGLPLDSEEVDAFSVYALEKALQTPDALAEADAHFEAVLAGNEIDSNLLFDEKPEEETSNASATEDVTLTLPNLSRLLSREGLTESSFFMGAFGYTLAKMTGQDDALFAVAENGRKTAATDRTVSMFVRTLPVLYHLDETQNAASLIRAGQEQFFASVQNDCLSFGTLAERYGVSADVMFVYQSEMLADAGAVSVAQLPISETFANLAVSVWKRGDGYHVHTEYRKDCYRAQTVRRFLSLYGRVANAFLQNAVLKEIPLADSADICSLDALNRTESPYDESATVVDLFRRAAARNPEKTAVVWGDCRYTYREAESLSSRIAAYLSGIGIKKGDTVSILLPRNGYMPIAALGALRAGAVYQPLDPSYPAERLSFMCKDADSKCLIADEALLPLLPDYTAPILRTSDFSSLPDGGFDAEPTPSDGFVLLYTSGTTGLPKGCKLLHRNVSAYVHAFNTLFAMDGDCVTGAYASFGFDAHLSELYPPLSVGAELHIIPEEIRLDLPVLKAYFENNRITHTVMTTQIARQFVTEYPEVKHLRSILCGGEKLATVTPPATYRLTNGYGPTEATVMVTCFGVDRVYTDIPIGKALPNAKLYVVDAYSRRVPVGVPGELIACGPQVAEGYLNRPDKTAEAFLVNPFEADATSVYRFGYKTGDVVRYLEDGNLEIIGRRDRQVKIRGFRIELTEVETVLREYPAVTDAAVIAVDNPAGGKCLHAYIVAKEPVDISKLNAFIKERKPSYMVPAATAQIDAIPLTPNFKVDKRKLPPIQTASSNRKSVGERRLTALEEELSQILSSVVGHTDFGVETDFSDAGITSISSIRLAVQLYKKYGLRISAKEILDGGNILSVENAVVSSFLSPQSAEQKAEVPLSASYPLTSSQLGVYTDSLARGTDAYLIPVLIEMTSPVPAETLKNAIRKAVAAHPSMCCYLYADEEGTPKVYPVPDMAFDVEEVVCDGLDVAPTHFAFEKSPLFRFRLLNVKGKQYLLFEIHHIIADGESVNILLSDVARACKGEEITPEAFTSFALAEEEESAKKGKEIEVAKAYYDSVFRGVSADYLPCPDRFDTCSYGECSSTLGTDRSAVRAYCTSVGVSESVFFSGAFALTLARFTSHTDALFSTVHNGRGDPRTENLVAMTVKTLPVFAEALPETEVKTFFRSLDDRLKKLKKYDLYSFAEASRKYGLSADPMFIYQGDLMQSNPLGRQISFKTDGAPKSALSLEVVGEANGFTLHAEFDAGRYSEALVKGFHDAFSTAVSELLTKQLLGDVSVCSPAALNEFAFFNDTEWKIESRPAYRLFEESVDRHPEKLAVVAGEQAYTYRQLDAMANAMAQSIAEIGIAKESTVALMLDRTAEIYVAELGVLKSANAFLFLSPEYPDERIHFILADASAKAIVTTRAVAERKKALFAQIDLPVLFADGISPDVSSPRLGLEISPDALAYLIYTSGSTGKPKGVTVLQRGLVTVSDANPKNADTLLFVNDEAVSTAVCAFTFDASIMEGFVALANGSTVCVASEEMIHNPESFCRYCLKNGVTSLLGTPSFLLNLSDHPAFAEVAKQLQTVLAGGEEFTSVLLKHLLELNPNLTVINGYGPSEATIACSSTVLRADRRITIGTPLANTKLYCLDAQNHVLPMGALGELTVVGDGVGKGYLNRDDLTRKAFIRIEGKPAFKTGDLAVITHDGQVEFHGRIDNQVKIRGLRVELGEIEAVMNGIDGMKNAVVTLKGSGENKYLAAYFTAKRRLEKEEIVSALSNKLASYMIPRHFLQLDEMPMTANGKIDKKALPEILAERKPPKKEETLTETEKAVCELFSSILSAGEILPDDNFFEMGGNSLLASRAVMMLKSRGYDVEYQTVFDCQTPRTLSAYLDRAKNASAEGVAVSDSKDPNDPDFSEVLHCNTLDHADKTERHPLGDVVLTGAVGFLGIHVLHELLETESGHIFCLVRKGSFPSPESRLNAISFYYFGQCVSERYADRITVLDADITSENLSHVFREVQFDTLINCAACVKHYAADDSIEFVNVHGVENLISLAKEKNACLIQISTTSVPGVHNAESLKNHTVLHENQIFTVDQMNNRYLISKYHAELCMLRAIREGMHGKIIRVGNLMGRYCDGEFQINMSTNAFLNALKGFSVIGKFPVGHSTEPMEFSPIDCTAKAIVTLAGTNDCFTMFHANSRYLFDEMRLMKACTRNGLPIQPTPDKDYYEEYNRLLGDPKMNRYLSALVTNDRPDIHSIEVDNRFTANVLYRLGFSWPFIDDAYLDRAIESLKELGFFDWEY